MENISLERKKQFIVENGDILNRDIRLTILNIIMMEIGKSVIIETSNKKEIDINLDSIGEKNVEILNHIYNIVQKRLETLNKPAKLNGM